MTMPVDPNALEQKPSRLSKWWPIGFFVVAVGLFIIGSFLTAGAYLSSPSGCWSSSSSYYENYDYSCSNANLRQFYGGVACFVIGGICKLIAWILLIAYCVKRRRSVQTSVYTAPSAGQPQQPYTPKPYPPSGADANKAQ